MSRAEISLSVNGEAVEVTFAPSKTLLELLREDLALTGTKHGCELGECGACAVLIDGEPQLSCLVLALECAGRSVETVEGMAQGAELHPLQAAFADLGAAQCGYCTPGILLTADFATEYSPLEFGGLWAWGDDAPASMKPKKNLRTLMQVLRLLGRKAITRERLKLIVQALDAPARPWS